jgi:apolipoprotein N-acyltransferase
MNEPFDFQHLNFSSRRHTFPVRLAILVGFFVATILFCVVIPPNIQFWLAIPVLMCLTWLATYGWRPGVNALINFLQNLLDH